MAKQKTGSSPDEKKDDGKKNTSLRLDKKTLKALKIRAIEEDSSVQKIIEQLIHSYLNTPTTRNP